MTPARPVGALGPLRHGMDAGSERFQNCEQPEIVAEPRQRNPLLLIDQDCEFDAISV